MKHSERGGLGRALEEVLHRLGQIEAAGGDGGVELDARVLDHGGLGPPLFHPVSDEHAPADVAVVAVGRHDQRRDRGRNVEALLDEQAGALVKVGRERLAFQGRQHQLVAARPPDALLAGNLDGDQAKTEDARQKRTDVEPSGWGSHAVPPSAGTTAAAECRFPSSTAREGRRRARGA